MFNTPPPWNITSVVDETASRSLDVEYQNASGRTLIVTVSFLANTTDVTDDAIVYARINSVSGAIGARDQWLGGMGFSAAAVVGQALYSGTVMVPPGYFYNMKTSTVFSGTVTLKSWIEAK